MNTKLKLLKKFVLLLVPVIVLCSYFEYQLRHHTRISSYAFKKELLQKNLTNIQTLILGSSQCFYGINPKHLQGKAFNLANVSQTIYYDRRLTQQYLQQMPQLKNVIIGIGYFSFFYQLQQIKEDWRTNYYNLHYNISYPQQPLFDMNNISYLSAYTFKRTINLALQQYIDTLTKNIDENGYFGKQGFFEISDSSGLQRVAVHHAENFVAVRKDIKKDLEEFIANLRQRNINVILITMPVFNTYYKHCNQQIVLDNKNYVDSLNMQYNCTHLNLFQDSSFTKNDFYDNDHLNTKGASKLTKMINAYLKN